MSYKKREQCLVSHKQCDEDASKGPTEGLPGSTPCVLGLEFTGPQTRSRKRKLEKACDADMTVVKHVFKGRNIRRKRFDTIVIDD